MIQPDIPAASNKSCGNCGRGVASNSTAGGTCPHCGAFWLYTAPKLEIRGQ